MGFFKKREKAAPSGDFDRENEKPIIKASICNGEHRLLDLKIFIQAK